MRVVFGEGGESVVEVAFYFFDVGIEPRGFFCFSRVDWLCGAHGGLLEGGGMPQHYLNVIIEW